MVLQEVDDNEVSDRVSEIQLPGNSTAGPKFSVNARVEMRISHDENIHRRSPSPNKPLFG